MIKMLLRMMIPSIAVFGLSFAFMIMFNPNFYLFSAFYLAVILCLQLIGLHSRNWHDPFFARKLFNSIVFYVLILVIIYLINFFIGNPLVAFIIIILIFSAWRLWKSRKIYNDTIDYCLNILRGGRHEHTNGRRKTKKNKRKIRRPTL